MAKARAKKEGSMKNPWHFEKSERLQDHKEKLKTNCQIYAHSKSLSLNIMFESYKNEPNLIDV